MKPSRPVLQTFVVISLLALSACVTFPSTPDTYKYASRSTQAVIVGSLTSHGINAATPYNGKIFATHTNGKRYILESAPSKLFDYSLSKKKTDFADVKGQVFVAAFEAGELTIDDWQLSAGNASFDPATPPHALKIDLKPSTITYIGNIHFDVHLGKNVFGISIPVDTAPTIKSKYERDIAVIKERYPGLRHSKIDDKTVELQPWATGPAGKRVDYFIPSAPR